MIEVIQKLCRTKRRHSLGIALLSASIATLNGFAIKKNMCFYLLYVQMRLPLCIDPTLPFNQFRNALTKFPHYSIE